MTNFVIRKRHNNLIVDKKDKDHTHRDQNHVRFICVVRVRCTPMNFITK